MKYLSDEGIITIIGETLPLNRYDNWLETRTLLLNTLHQHLSPEQYQLVLNTGYERWTKEYDKFLRNGDFLNELFLTAYANFVTGYYTAEQDPTKITGAMVGLLGKLTWIDSEWCKDESAQITKFHLYLTHLYLLSFAYRNKGMDSPDVISLFRTLKLRRPLSDHMTGSKYDKPLEQIERNLILSDL